MHLLPQFRAIAAHELNRAGYARLLDALLAYHAAIADMADRAGLAAFSSSSRRREHLQRDLGIVAGMLRHPREGEAPSPDVSHGETDGTWLPACAGPTKKNQRAIVLGALYVAEGSMLGGRVIARQLDYLFGDAPEGRSFFIGTREDDSQWRKLIAALEEADDGQNTLNAMISGAEASFAHFDR